MAPSSKKRSRNRNTPPPSLRKARRRLATVAAPKTDSDEDYNIRSLQRTRLLTKIKEVICDADVSPTFWACCQLADIKCLQDIAKAPKQMILGYDNPLMLLPVQWNQRFRDVGPYDWDSHIASQRGYAKKRKLNSDGQSSVQRSEQQADKCNERDNHRCVLTKQSFPHAAHLFPHSVLNPLLRSDQSRASRMIPRFWDLLGIFWDKDRIDKWKETIFPDHQNPSTGIDRCFNLISLNPSAHVMWAKGLFALKPLELSSDRKQLTVGFFWQVPSNYTIDSRADLLSEPSSSKGLNRAGNNFLCCIDHDGSLREFNTGDVFTLTSKDPENLPLPSMELLDMQWVLQRLVGMSGAAGWPKLDWNDNGSGDDDCWLAPEASDKDAVLKRVSDWVDTV